MAKASVAFKNTFFSLNKTDSTKGLNEFHGSVLEKEYE